MKALIIDDERLARNELRRLLGAHPDVEIAGESANAQAALLAIANVEPDLIFLDVQMPGCTGLELLEKLDDVPLVIFTTAYDEYAVRAFEVNALDYLLKPIAATRLDAALAKARKTLAAANAEPAPAARGAKRSALQQVFVRDGERCWIVRLADIRLLESEGNYTRLYFANERALILRSLTALQEKLDPEIFFRANRSQIVNLRSIENVQPAVDGGLIIQLRQGPRVGVSRRQSKQLRELMSL